MKTNPGVKRVRARPGRGPRYWIWVTRPTGPDEPIILAIPEAVASGELRFDQGLLVEGDVPPVVLERDAGAGGTLSDNLVAPGVRGLVFSARLQQLLQKGGVQNLQYFDLTITGSDAARDGYRIANVVGRVACLDLEASRLQVDAEATPRISDVDSLVLVESRIRELDLFRLHEDADIVVASDRVRRLCQQHRVTGVEFVDPSRFQR